MATFSTAGLGVGLHEIEAVYSGDTVYPPATAKPMWIAVGSTKQVRLLRFVETFQQNITDQISPSQIGDGSPGLTGASGRGLLPGRS